jgi:hypothetical protein
LLLQSDCFAAAQTARQSILALIEVPIRRRVVSSPLTFAVKFQAARCTVTSGVRAVVAAPRFDNFER